MALKKSACLVLFFSCLFVLGKCASRRWVRGDFDTDSGFEFDFPVLSFLFSCVFVCLFRFFILVCRLVRPQEVGER